MDLTRDMTHSVRELGHVRHKRTVRASTDRPAVVKDNVVVAKVTKTVIDHFLGGTKKEIFADIAGKGVPIILH